MFSALLNSRWTSFTQTQLKSFLQRAGFLLLLTMLAGAPAQLLAQSTSPTVIDVAIPDTFVTQTESIILPVTISDVSDLGIFSFEFTISFDSTIIAIDDVISMDGIASSFLFLNNLDQGGNVFIAAAGVDSLKGSGPLFYLEASFLQDGASEMNFDRVSFEVDSIEVVMQHGRLRNISLADTEHPREVPEQLLISGNYPNPFRSTSTITLDLPDAALVSVEIYNLTGQLKRTYPSRAIAAGENQLITIDASSLAPGPYFYRIIARSDGILRYGTGAMTIIH